MHALFRIKLFMQNKAIMEMVESRTTAMQTQT